MLVVAVLSEVLLLVLFVLLFVLLVLLFVLTVHNKEAAEYV